MRISRSTVRFERRVSSANRWDDGAREDRAQEDVKGIVGVDAGADAARRRRSQDVAELWSGAHPDELLRRATGA
jgi:hypothetical protein